MIGSRERALAVLAVKKVADRLSPGRICFTVPGIDTTLSRGIGRFGLTALRAAVGKTGLIRLQFELF